jgi:HlyD family secretion protein
MRANRPRRLTAVLATAVLAAGAAWLAWPQPVPVDLATVASGRMQVTVDDEAKTRVRHIYTVSAPIAGKVLRTSRHVGDQVVADETVVAVMQPTMPSFIDIRSREELQAALTAAEAAVKLAEHEVHRIGAALEFSLAELRRAQSLARTDVISARALDKAKLDVESNEAALGSAKAQLDVRRSERASLAARLIEPSSPGASSANACCIQIRSPVTGRVLKLNQESEAVVPAGTPLIEIGDPADLEVVAELLSTDAVQITPGSAVRIDGWGGPSIEGRVTRIDPAGFLKVSALGIEEQRVRTIIDFAAPPAAWSRLGHDFRVIVHVTIWESDNALTAPIGALFRQGDAWSVFVARDGRAVATAVQVGRRNNQVAEIVAGLSAGDRIVVHPSDRVRDGVRVSDRGLR